MCAMIGPLPVPTRRRRRCSIRVTGAASTPTAIWRVTPVAYAGFNRLYEAGRMPGAIIEAACWAHARRKFFDLARINKAPIAVEAVERW